MSSPLHTSLIIAAKAMKAQNERISLIAENLAQVGVRAPKGEMPYQRQVVSFETYFDQSADANLLRVKKILKDKSPPVKKYEPFDPAADKDGFVYEPDIKPIIEMTDMRDAGKSYEADLVMFQRVLSMLQNHVGLLKG